MIEDRPAAIDLGPNETGVLNQSAGGAGRHRRSLQLARRQCDRAKRRRQFVRCACSQCCHRHETLGSCGLLTQVFEVALALGQRIRGPEDEIGHELRGNGYRDPHAHEMRREVVQAVMPGVHFVCVPVHEEGVTRHRRDANQGARPPAERQGGQGDLNTEDDAEGIERPAGELQEPCQQRGIGRDAGDLDEAGHGLPPRQPPGANRIHHGGGG